MTLLASTTGTFVSGVLMSYFAVWAFSLIVNEPGSFAYESLVAILESSLPSVSVAVA